ncbi:hypothetical protein Y032_0356g3362 [Ancylostoma ceylanicum]|nr:hypothetical protein Y032_0356g3362 [Ancylostoma ceylanicum]
MLSFYFILTTAVTPLLSVSTNERSSTVDCDSSTSLSKKNVSDFLDAINDRRSKLVKGFQPDGESDEWLLWGLDMFEMEWNCTLESLALSALKTATRCNSPVPPIAGTTGFY